MKPATSASAARSSLACTPASRTASRTAPRTAPCIARVAALAAALAVVPYTVDAARADGALYRWSEPDGSLTFSPTPPSDGTPYEEVDPMTMRPADDATPPARRATAKTGAAGRPSAAADAPPSPAPAPTLGAATVDGGTRTAPRVPDDGAGASAAYRQAGGADEEGDADDGSGRVIVAADKEERCDELQKRVVSLERRLSTALTPEQMDDTVVHMVRYQQSFERNCRR